MATTTITDHSSGPIPVQINYENNGNSISQSFTVELDSPCYPPENFISVTNPITSLIEIVTGEAPTTHDFAPAHTNSQTEAVCGTIELSVSPANALVTISGSTISFEASSIEFAQTNMPSESETFTVTFS